MFACLFFIFVECCWIDTNSKNKVSNILQFQGICNFVSQQISWNKQSECFTCRTDHNVLKTIHQKTIILLMPNCSYVEHVNHQNKQWSSWITEHSISRNHNRKITKVKLKSRKKTVMESKSSCWFLWFYTRKDLAQFQFLLLEIVYIRICIYS